MMPRVLVGIVARQQVEAAFAISLTDAMIGNGMLFHADTRWAVGHITDDGRNDIAEAAIENGYDYLIFLDSDMVFPPAIVLGLLRRAQRDNTYSCAIYNTRSDYRVNLYRYNPAEKQFMSIQPDMDIGGVCDAGGTGAMCIPVHLLKQIKFPYFSYVYTETKQGRKRWSEDIVFCKSMLDKGYSCSYIPMVCGHVISNVVHQVDATRYEITRIDG